jgi:signal transduction histidine kinase
MVIILMSSDKYLEKNAQDVLENLKKIASAVMYAAEGDNVEQVLERIANVARELVKARYAALGAPDGKGGLRYFKVSGITQDQILEIAHLPIGRGLLGAIMHERQVICLPDMKDDPRSVGFPAGHPPMKSLLGVPIQAGQELLGMLYVCDRLDGQPFDEDDEWLAETLAGYAAVAIAGAQLGDHRGRLRTLEERERFGMDLHDGVIQSLYAIGMHLDLMRSGGSMSDDEMAQIIDGLNQVIEDVRRYILDLKSAHTRTIRDYFRDILNRLYVPSTVRLVLQVPNEPPPFTSSTFEDICQIANEAISNAIRHSGAEHITISTSHDQGRFQIVIEDDGIGFDPDALAENSGLGLHNMKRRAEIIGGRVHIDSEVGKGTQLTVSMPVLTR